MNGDVTGSHIPLDPVENRQSRVIRQANVQDDGVREILPRHEHTFIGGFGNEALESCFMRKVAENPSEGSIVLHNEDYPAVPGQLLSVILEIGRAHVCTPVTNAHLVCRLLLDKKYSTPLYCIFSFS